MNKLTFNHFLQIHNGGYSLDMVYLVTQVQQGVDVKSLCEESVKLQALYQSIYRKGLVTEDGKVTLTGRSLLEFSEEETAVKLTKKKPVATDFEAWWKAYPGTDTFVYQGKTFSGGRSLRVKKEDCKKKFNSILEEGEYTAKDLIDALEFEVTQKKNNSIKEKTNKLTFMQNSLTYLNQRTFEPFIELVRSGINAVETTSVGGTDI